MQPEYLVAGAHSLLKPAPRVELGDFGRPSVSALDARNERLADAELCGDLLLHSAVCDCGQNSSVPLIQSVHPLTLPLDDCEGVVGLFCLDRNEGAHSQQEALHIWRGRNGVAVEPPVAPFSAAFVFLNPPVAEPLVDGIERWAVSVCETQSHAALVLVDLDAALPIKEARDVAEEGLFAEIVHPYALTHIRVSNNIEAMAVPVMRWIGERIARVDEIEVLREAA